jgi:hypothetical protein
VVALGDRHWDLANDDQSELGDSLKDFASLILMSPSANGIAPTTTRKRRFPVTIFILDGANNYLYRHYSNYEHYPPLE